MRIIIFSFIFLVFSSLSFPIGKKYQKENASPATLSSNGCELLYEQMNLCELMHFDAFKSAYTGYTKLNINNNPLLTVIDFSLPSSEKRMYVLDLEKRKVLFVSYVSHGRNSGENFATSFSNLSGSHKSSLGFYRTAGTYNGSNGYSLQLDGLEEGINDKARSRAIVIHGADYCSEKVIKSTGRLGRSFGCPALPKELTKPVINTIKGGSLLFIYAGRPDYTAMSKVDKISIEEHSVQYFKTIFKVLNLY
ncbi:MULTISPECIES: murein L,D-transpeptidase catalytic domain family protein [Proteiniphilum]|uniref:murein L,D-transpeptidase catalytic domain family protein n=1 Tax=Proteiniphilum TaxID=294702 RepID=UPI001EEC0E2B|nr:MULTISPECIES: murein L,D-transpeptidase catalytic domain family protein [Proteiniphilum]ULB33191.1 murein L,D-transpeptidase catalytic domain family protein [Proteiniphilum propionicum]